jgi:hypothetical protein
MVTADDRGTAPVNSRRIASLATDLRAFACELCYLARVSRVPVHEPLLS